MATFMLVDPDGRLSPVCSSARDELDVLVAKKLERGWLRPESCDPWCSRDGEYRYFPPYKAEELKRRGWTPIAVEKTNE